MVRSRGHHLRPRVLLVDDDVEARGSYERLLRANGFVVAPVGSMGEAMERVSEQMPDVVIADVLLPDVDVVALVSRIRAHQAGARVPVIGIATEWTAEIQERARLAGITACVEKRGALFQLLAEIYSALADGRRDRD